MEIRNIGAYCSNCGTKRSFKNCNPCMKMDGRQGWTPMKGIKVNIINGHTFTKGGKAIPTMFREVLANEMEH